MLSLRLAVVLTVFLTLSSCSSGEDSAQPAPEGDAAASADKTVAETVKEVPAVAKEDSESIEPAVGKEVEVAGKKADEVKESVSELPADVAAVLESGFGVEKLRTIVQGLSAENLEQLSLKLKSAVENKESAIQAIREKLAGLKPAELLGSEASNLKRSLEAAASELKVFQEKLAVVTGKLGAQ